MKNVMALKVRKDLMNAEEKQSIKTTIASSVAKGEKPDPEGLARQFKRLPATIRKLVEEVTKSMHTPTYTELTYDSMWGIIGCMLTGMLGADVVAKYGCTLDDIKFLSAEYGIPWTETLAARHKMMHEYGPNWKEAAASLAQWQPQV